MDQGRENIINNSVEKQKDKIEVNFGCHYFNHKLFSWINCPVCFLNPMELWIVGKGYSVVSEMIITSNKVKSWEAILYVACGANSH